MNLRFTPPEWDEIETAAKRRAMSPADLIRSAIFAHLRDRPLPLTKRVLVNVELQRELILFALPPPHDQRPRARPPMSTQGPNPEPPVGDLWVGGGRVFSESVGEYAGERSQSPLESAPTVTGRVPDDPFGVSSRNLERARSSIEISRDYAQEVLESSRPSDRPAEQIQVAMRRQLYFDQRRTSSLEKRWATTCFY